MCSCSHTCISTQVAAEFPEGVRSLLCGVICTPDDLHIPPNMDISRVNACSRLLPILAGCLPLLLIYR